MKMLLALLLLPSISFAGPACMQQGEDGRMYVAEAVNIPDNVTEMPVATTITPLSNDPSFSYTGSLPPLNAPGYIYYTVPIGTTGGLNLVTPWSAAILAEGYDFIGKESITQGFVPLFAFWKITGVIGAGINGKGEGSPMGGAIMNLAQVKLSETTDFNIAITGGYNFNADHALAVLSGSVQFLK